MFKSFLRTASGRAIAAVMFFTTVVAWQWLWKEDGWRGWQKIVRSDVEGYYGYLLAVFVRHDLGHEPENDTYLHQVGDRTLNKYYAGTSVMMAPFFLAGHAAARLSPRAPHDGHTGYDYLAIAVGGLFYTALGFVLLRAVLRRLSIRDGTIAWIVIALGFASTLMPYAALQPGWSHIYSWCAIAAFLYIALRLQQGGSERWLIALGAIYGLIVLIRPVNGLVILALPVLLGRDTMPWCRARMRRPMMVGLALVAALVMMSIQAFLWHAQTGNWWEWGYRGEGFYWDNPKFFQMLLGIRRGLFVWTPVLLLPALSVLLLWRLDKVRSVGAFVYWLAFTYVLASWWMWYYGSGFGSRVYLDHYAVFAIPWALVMDRWSVPLRRWTKVFIVGCAALHLFQFWQYKRGIIHPEHMDMRKYEHVLLRTGDEYRNCLGGNFQEAPYHPNGMDLLLTAACDLEWHCTHWEGGMYFERADIAPSGNYVCLLDSLHRFSPTLRLPAGSVPLGRALFLVIDLQRYEARAGDSQGTLCIASVETPGMKPDYYDARRMNPVPGTTDRTWRKVHYEIPLPALRKGEEVRFYLWDQDGKTVLLDNLYAEVYAVRPYGRGEEVRR